MVRRTFTQLDFIEEGRQEIHQWSAKRERKYQGFQKSVHVFRIFAFNTNLLRSFIENFNFMVVLQMALAGLVTYACKSLSIVYDVHVSLFISPIVFPLAFSINTDFQRKEKVLEDLANFKSSAMMWLFCMRDWKETCTFDKAYMKAVGNKIKGLLFHLREYLLTEKIERRKFIARVIYEDLSDMNQLNEKVRCSDLPANSPLISRIIHLVNMMCLAFERLRVVREYRSPRSIRSFTKVLIFALPILLSPYYVYLGNKDNNSWSPYYISIMVAFVFGALQGVQDKLDDPFDGMSEDDIKLDSLDEWTLQSLEATENRTYKIGRFQVSANPETTDKAKTKPTLDTDEPDHLHNRKTFYHKEKPVFRNRFISHRPRAVKSPLRSARSAVSEDDTKSDEFEFHPYAGVLNNIKGNTTILRGGHIKARDKSSDDLASLNNSLSKDSNKSISFNQVIFSGNSTSQRNIRSTTNTPIPDTFNTLFNMANVDQMNTAVHETVLDNAIPNGNLGLSNVDAPFSGVASYLASLRNHSGSLSRSNSHGSHNSGSLQRSVSIESHKSPQSSHHSTPDSSFSKPQFYVGKSPVTKNVKTPQPTLKSRFHINSPSADPLINGLLSTDSDLSSSSDLSSVDFKHIEPDPSPQQHHSLNGYIKPPFTITPVAVRTSHSENGLHQELKDEEVFI